MSTNVDGHDAWLGRIAGCQPGSSPVCGRVRRAFSVTGFQCNLFHSLAWKTRAGVPKNRRQPFHDREVRNSRPELMSDPVPQNQIDAATAYEQLFVPALFRQWPRRVIAAACVQLGERVLDVACGTGILAREVAAVTGPAGFVAGVDLNPGMLRGEASRPCD